jgi:hypothetical protein
MSCKKVGDEHISSVSALTVEDGSKKYMTLKYFGDRKVYVYDVTGGGDPHEIIFQLTDISRRQDMISTNASTPGRQGTYACGTRTTKTIRLPITNGEVNGKVIGYVNVSRIFFDKNDHNAYPVKLNNVNELLNSYLSGLQPQKCGELNVIVDGVRLGEIPISIASDCNAGPKKKKSNVVEDNINIGTQWQSDSSELQVKRQAQAKAAEQVNEVVATEEEEDNSDASTAANTAANTPLQSPRQDPQDPQDPQGASGGKRKSSSSKPSGKPSSKSSKSSKSSSKSSKSSHKSSSKSATKERVMIKNRERIVYVGPKGGRYIKSKGEYKRI